MPMLELSRTQSVIVECLKSGPKTAYDIEQAIDRGKDFSPDYVKSMVFKINQKRRIIEAFNEDGQRYWRLIAPEKDVEYRIREDLADLRDGHEEIKEMIHAYPYRATIDLSRRVLVAGVVLLCLVFFGFGYWLGYESGETTVYIDRGVMERYIAGSGAIR